MDAPLQPLCLPFNWSFLTDVADVVYCAYVERGANAAAVEPHVAMLANALDALVALGAKLEHVVLFGSGSCGSCWGRCSTYRCPYQNRWQTKRRSGKKTSRNMASGKRRGPISPD